MDDQFTVELQTLEDNMKVSIAKEEESVVAIRKQCEKKRVAMAVLHL